MLGAAFVETSSVAGCSEDKENDEGRCEDAVDVVDDEDTGDNVPGQGRCREELCTFMARGNRRSGGAWRRNNWSRVWVSLRCSLETRRLYNCTCASRERSRVSANFVSDSLRARERMADNRFFNLRMSRLSLPAWRACATLMLWFFKAVASSS